MPPTWPHNCDGCQYLETFTIDGIRHDAYYCPAGSLGNHGSALARFGPEPPEYWSVPIEILRTSAHLQHESIIGQSMTTLLRRHRPALFEP